VGVLHRGQVVPCSRRVRRVGEVGIGTSGVSPDAAHSRGETIPVIVEGPVAIEGFAVYVSRGLVADGT
jgi:hypothetical protein